MKSVEFMYWLQGYFEVCDKEEVSKEQFKKIKNHLKMAEITDGGNCHPFCFWLKGFIEAIETDCPSKNQTIVIKNKLNDLFDHVVGRKLAQNNESESYRPTSTGMQLNPSEISQLIKC